jgi:hypothetical protein
MKFESLENEHFRCGGGHRQEGVAEVRLLSGE